MKYTLLHNPRCSKSRQVLELLTARKLQMEVVDYLKTPLSLDSLRGLASKLEGPISQLIREADAKKIGINLDCDDQELLVYLSRSPELLQRPILISERKAAIGRPPDAVLHLLE